MNLTTHGHVITIECRDPETVRVERALRHALSVYPVLLGNGCCEVALAYSADGTMASEDEEGAIMVTVTRGER